MSDLLELKTIYERFNGLKLIQVCFFSGIRLENLVHIVKADTPHNFRDRGYLTFEDLTVVPIQKKMIEPKFLTEAEINYINQYHQKCKDMVGPLLRSMGKKDGLNWLIRETSPIG